MGARIALFAVAMAALSFAATLSVYDPAGGGGVATFQEATVSVTQRAATGQFVSMLTRVVFRLFGVPATCSNQVDVSSHSSKAACCNSHCHE
jgi:hypothetical protein